MSNVSTCITFDAVSSIITMTISGTANAQDVINTYNTAHHYMQLHNSYKLLIDVSGVILDFPAGDIVKIGYAISNYLKDCIIARIVNFDGFMQDLFLQKVKRLGLNVENFESVKHGQIWLEDQSGN